MTNEEAIRVLEVNGLWKHSACPKGMKPWIWIEGEIIQCAGCGFKAHADAWLDIECGDLKFHKAFSFAISALKENEGLRGVCKGMLRDLEGQRTTTGLNRKGEKMIKVLEDALASQLPGMIKRKDKASR